MKNDKNDKDIKRLKFIANRLLKRSNTTHGLRRSLRLLLKEIAIYQNCLGSFFLSGYHLETDKYKKVQIGGGKHTLNDFLNIDIVPPADMICDVREGLPLKTNSLNLIFSEHFFEHIDYPQSAKKFIKECYRTLEKRGKLVLGVPDSQLVISAYYKRDSEFWKQMLKKWYSKRNCFEHFNTYIDLVNYHFRDQDDDKKYSPHYWAYDFKKLEFLLKKAGFTKIKKWRFDKSIANPERKWGSIYVEAIK